ncbi:helix-turn-helix domain-containing protein [Clostridium brassicae]|uniref:Helix-turn-helix domain-containing protein n=1 Tax=Clostridium brassicae TaxID=2999072 RepID=A0ABT4D4F1_9CLOT|nr:helix-turn-helix domain-containing protein [Clostridium brassicae]MCY6957163.1 helix-turn-helix domain-containing protein [Clostridium brassicae]
MSDINIGQKLLEYRKAKNLTIRELAELAQVTPSLLSQIERGIANPSINTLKIISKALQVPLFHFFMDSINTDELVVRADERKRLIFPQSKDLSYELLCPDLSGKLEALLMKLTPGSCSSEDAMGHEGEEIAFVLSGKTNIYIDGNLIILDTGDSIKIPPNVKHKWENSYDKDAHVIFAITPPYF